MTPIATRQQDAIHNTTDVYAQRRQLRRRVLELEALVGELAGALESAAQELRYLRTRRNVFYRLSFNKAEADGFINAQTAIRQALAKAREAR
jgi:hypothetical protein